MDGDGDIDYDRYTLDELREAENTINGIQYPKNYANLMAAIESRVAEQAKAEAEAVPPSDPLEISGKTAESVISEYESTLIRAKVVSGIGILLLLPNVLGRFVDFERYLALDSTIRLWLMAIGTTTIGLFAWLFWNCPNCGKFPGGGWRRRECKSCGVFLRDAAD